MNVDDAVRAIRAALDEALATEPAADRAEALLSALASLRLLREHVAAWEPELITAARADGTSWAVLAPALGVASRQAAERRYLRLQPSATGEGTGEERVRAQRDRRAGDRVVSSWARDNSAALRQLAGQVSGLADLTATGRERAGRVQEALGKDDPAALLSPLAGAQDHLGDGNAALAARLADVTRHTDQLRRDAARSRRREK
ncbi:HSP18 transcriptional regulator [Amycolatopsis sp. CA-230715]|uniref:HSP18 transcriptional regulator n=1 Tax=Amycolatopsis sp. CA-230715 TaxID=2745196 RepID=UPI001C0250EA|nr:HSP18 transcriptional regulator [Amycolatopsis sp. CA-230715]QWF82634.1 hypothetical protein HUW46_06073 [Amycolatopsis sp. CA-230715]